MSDKFNFIFNLETNKVQFTDQDILNAAVIFVDTNSNGNSCECQAEIKKLQDEIYSSNQEIACASKQYHETLVLNFKKDLMIRQLKQKLHDNRFSQFNKNFSASTIDDLKLIDDTPEKDSVFILKTIKDLYVDDLPRLKNKTYSGKTKEALSPEKVDVIRKIFIERLDAAEKNNQNNIKRKFKFPTYVKAAIESINRKKNLSHAQ